MIDSIPLWFAVPAIVTAWAAWIVVEYRASQRFWAERDASDPVVVTASGARRDNRPYACKSVESVR